jgi:hypothetical protein
MTSAPVPEERSGRFLRSARDVDLLRAHDHGGRAGEDRQHLDLLELGGLEGFDQLGQHAAGGLGVREEVRQVHGFGDGEASRLVAHGEVADVGRAGDHAVKDILGSEQGAAGIGVDLDFSARALLDLGFPVLHLDARKRRGRREVRVVQRDSACGSVNRLFFSASRQRKKSRAAERGRHQHLHSKTLLFVSFSSNKSYRFTRRTAISFQGYCRDFFR